MSSMRQKGTLKKVLRYIRKYAFFLICSLVLAAVTVALTLYVPILTGQAIDSIVRPGDVDFANVACGRLELPCWLRWQPSGL